MPPWGWLLYTIIYTYSYFESMWLHVTKMSEIIWSFNISVAVNILFAIDILLTFKQKWIRIIGHTWNTKPFH